MKVNNTITLESNKDVEVSSNCLKNSGDYNNTETKNEIEWLCETRTANGGYHWLFEILCQDFPKGLTQGTYWTPIQNSHAEIKIIGSNQYLIERGDGYEPSEV